MKKYPTLLTALFIFAAAQANAGQATFMIDASHSSVVFKIKHFFTQVPGSFGEMSGYVQYDSDAPEKSVAQASLSIASIDTNNAKRDNHLQEADYFYSEKYPKIIFKSDSWEKVGDNSFKVIGQLEMHGHTNPVTLDVKLLGIGKTPKGQLVSGWTAKTTLDRTQWGINSGQPVVGKDVEIEINIEAYAQ